jgi:hypothetical protein
MRHVHSLHFDTLEAKQLLSKGTVPVLHATPVAVTGPLLLSGTLAVDNNAASQTTNPDGSTTTTTPVAGKLGTIGRVRGVWNETTDQFGDVEGLDALRLRLPKGKVVLEFNNESPGPAQRAGHGVIYDEEAQRLGAAAGAYIGSTETGSIDLYPNSGRSEIVTLALHSKTT